MIQHLFTPEITYALGWTLVHSLWQGALFALLLAVTLILLRSYSAQARYLLAAGLLGGFFLTTAFTFAQLYQTADVSVVPAVELPALTSAPLPAPSEAIPFEWPSEEVDNAAGVIGSDAEHSSGFWERTIAYYNDHLPLIVTIWLMGVFVLLLRLLGQLAYVQRLGAYGTSVFPEHWQERLRELEQRLDLYVRVRYALSGRVSSPLTYGWMRPVLLFPSRLFEQLEETQIYAILAHELAHIKRNDFLVNILQQLLATVFFYHPGVWWMSARIQEEREHSCDDLAIQITQQPVGYAKTLIQLKEHQLHPSSLAMAYQGSSGSGTSGFALRIKRLLSNSFGTGTFSEGLTTAFLLVLILALAYGATGRAVATNQLQSAGSEQAREESGINLDDAAVDFDFRVDFDEPEVASEEIDYDTYPPDTSKDRTWRLFLEAVDDGSLELVEHFLDKGVPVNGRSDNGTTPLMLAADENHPEIVRLLLDRGAEPDLINDEGITALMYAAREGSYASAVVLLEAGADHNFHGPDHGRTAIHYAADEGFPNIVQLLIDYGVEPDQLDHQRRTALMYAAEEDRPEVIALLLREGADPGLNDADGNTALYYAAEEGAKSSLDYLLGRANLSQEQIIDPDLLVASAGEGQLFVVHSLVVAGADVNRRNSEGITPLMAAAEEGKSSVAEFLLDQGADINGRIGSNGPSPLLIAAEEGHKQLIELLIERDADIEATTDFRDFNFGGSRGSNNVTFYRNATALHIAVEENRASVVEVLLNGGLNPNAKAGKARFEITTGMDWRILQQQVPRLEDARSKLDAEYDVEGWTPLMEAVEMDVASIVELLLNAGADPNATTNTGISALSIAQSKGASTVLKLLEDHR